ncbi:helix-turn-helix transcriptional regulator [Thermanaerosceptrum fracticalcis]|uniref:helix-turn-helix transcriptional regulator n=1 Tax=Thermanaerosceptrum fracticalcis TaxID=1712410 RepID=UPI001FADA428|nr:helix-turn-helix transcriptional regulator [Thermanaerosceptrum fracticalcis]
MIKLQPVPNKKMKKLREEMGLTQAEVATKLEMPLSSYAMIEAGYRRNPRREVQKKIANFYSCTVDELFFDDDVHETRTLPEAKAG